MPGWLSLPSRERFGAFLSWLTAWWRNITVRNAGFALLLVLYKLFEDRLLGSVNEWIDTRDFTAVVAVIDTAILWLPSITWSLVPLTLAFMIRSAWKQTSLEWVHQTASNTDRLHPGTTIRDAINYISCDSHWARNSGLDRDRSFYMSCVYLGSEVRTGNLEVWGCRPGVNEPEKIDRATWKNGEYEIKAPSSEQADFRAISAKGGTPYRDLRIDLSVVKDLWPEHE